MDLVRALPGGSRASCRIRPNAAPGVLARPSFVLRANARSPGVDPDLEGRRAGMYVSFPDMEGSDMGP